MTTREQIERITGKPVSVICHIGRRSDSFIASYINSVGDLIGFEAADQAAALKGLLAFVSAAQPIPAIKQHEAA